ncbi:MAG: AraC family transcriptional regulator [Patescibacteria group bacterium]
MDYYAKVQEAADYIEANLGREIKLQELAGQAFFSSWHFHRIFQAVTGETLADYIRKRRLTRAVQAIIATRRDVLDIALDNGFNSRETFIRAFKKAYGMTPGAYRRRGGPVILQERLIVAALKYQFRNGVMDMEPKIVKRNASIILGYELRTNTAGGENSQAIPEFWEKADLGRLTSIVNRLHTNETLGLCLDGDESGNFSYVIGVEVSSAPAIPAGMSLKTLPAAKYAVFTAKGPCPQAIQDMWRYIYGEWFPRSGLERAETPDFELYDERCVNNDDRCEVDIYIPIK